MSQKAGQCAPYHTEPRKRIYIFSTNSRHGDAEQDTYERTSRAEADGALFKWAVALGQERYDTAERQMWASDGR